MIKGWGVNQMLQSTQTIPTYVGPWCSIATMKIEKYLRRNFDVKVGESFSFNEIALR